MQFLGDTAVIAYIFDFKQPSKLKAHKEVAEIQKDIVKIATLTQFLKEQARCTK